MSDLISRADAIKAIRKCKFESDMPSYWYRGMECAQDIISAIPSAETHEIRTETHGVCLISKDDAMGAVQDHFNANGFKGYDDGQKMMDRIKALPSAEAVQGEWKPFDLTWGRNIYFCTVCKESTEVPTVNGQPSYNYCPNCGTRMKGGAE